MKRNYALAILAVSVMLSIIMHFKVFTLPIQGKDAWRQSKTGWNIRNFARFDANILNPRRAYLNNDNIERYEFPLMQWSVAMVEKVTGEYFIVKRVCVFLISVLTLLAVYRIGLLLTEDQLIAALGVWIFTFLPTFFYNATSIMPDPTALCFGMFYVLYFFKFLKFNQRNDLILSGVFIALAGLSKLPFILLGSLSLYYFIALLRKKPAVAKNEIIRFVLVNGLALIPVFGWYLLAIQDWEGNNIQTGFLSNFQGWPLFFEFLHKHLLIIFPQNIFNLPALIFFGLGVSYCIRERKLFFVSTAYFFVPLVLLFAYFLYILNVIEREHDYYHMPFYPIILLAILNGLDHALKWKGWKRIPVFILLLVMPFICWFRVRDYWNIEQAYLNSDYWYCREQLISIGERDETAIIVNDVSVSAYAYVIDKRAYIFWGDHLPVLWIKDIIKNKDVRYLFSDSRPVENQEGFNEVIQQLILECGSIKVFLLKPKEEIQL